MNSRLQPRRGISLLEVVVALGVLALGVTAVLMLYMNNLRTTRQAKNELIVAMLMQDLRAKSQLAALYAKAGNPPQSIFDRSDWLLRDPAAPDDPGAPQKLDEPAVRLERSALNGQNWRVIKQRYDEIAAAGGEWDSNTLYANFQFRMRTVLPPEVENNQFMDLDGYDLYDAGTQKLQPNIFQDETDDGTGKPTQHIPVQPPASSRADGTTGSDNGYFGPPRPSHGAAYDPRGMRYHIKRIQCVLGWDLSNPSDIYSGQNHTFYFSVYNPDLHKRPQ